MATNKTNLAEAIMKSEFQAMPNELFRIKELSVNAKACWAFLLSRQDVRDVSFKQIARSLSCAVNTAKSAVKQLAEANMLVTERNSENAEYVSQLLPMSDWKYRAPLPPPKEQNGRESKISVGIPLPANMKLAQLMSESGHWVPVPNEIWYLDELTAAAKVAWCNLMAQQDTWQLGLRNIVNSTKGSKAALDLLQAEGMISVEWLDKGLRNKVTMLDQSNWKHRACQSGNRGYQPGNTPCQSGNTPKTLSKDSLSNTLQGRVEKKRVQKIQEEDASLKASFLKQVDALFPSLPEDSRSVEEAIKDALLSCETDSFEEMMNNASFDY